MAGLLLVIFSIQNILNFDTIEELFWFASSNSVAIEAYKNYRKDSLLFAWFCYSFGLLFDILEDLPQLENNLITQYDTSLKHLGILLIFIGLYKLIIQKKEYIGVLESEVIQRKSLQDQLIYDATHDALTKIFNRRACFEHFESLQKHNKYLLYFDLDNFKAANDEYGHNIGDQILIDFTTALEKTFKRENCFRVGGDEFLAFDNNGDYLQDQQTLKQILLDKLDSFQVGVSIGIIELDDCSSADDLIHQADQAMYKEKFRSRELA